MSVAVLQRHVDDKIRVILEAYLRSALASAAVPGVSDRLAALEISVGLDSTQLPPSGMADLLPRVEVYGVGAPTSYDLTLDGVDCQIGFAVAGIAQFDGADFSAAARSAQLLASYAAEVLETRLPDPGGSDPTPIYRVDIVSAMNTAATLLDGGDTRLYTMRATCLVDCYCRATFGYLPSYAPAVLEPDAGILLSADAAAPVLIDATSLGSIAARRQTTVSVTAAQLAAGTNAIVDFAPVSTWPTSSPWTVYMSRHDAAQTGTTSPADQTASVPLASYDIQTGDRWVVSIVNADTLQPVIFSIDWIVT